MADIDVEAVAALLQQFGLVLSVSAETAEIDGSYWGAPEAGLVGRCVIVRHDTPVHSLLHETGHLVCMSESRRARLYRDAGGDELEEAAVCCLQVILADYLPDVGRDRLMADMDSWGYSFRRGSTAAWLADDADDARQWLRQHGLLNDKGQPSWNLRR